MFNRAKLVMIVDDEKDFAYLLKAGLEKGYGYRVVTVSESGRALPYARRFKPDVILLDITMPGINGFAVLEAIKKDMRTTAIPVIMLTARLDQDSKLQASRLYNEDYVCKPAEIKILAEAIEKAVVRRPCAAGECR